MTAAPLVLHLVGSQTSDGRVRRVETTAAEAVPGVRLVLTASDLPSDGSAAGRPLLAGGPLLFQGQEVAAIVADNPYVATDAAELLEVQLDFDDGPAASAAAEDRQAADANANVDVDVAFSRRRWHTAPLQTQRCLAVPVDGGVVVRASVGDRASFASRLAAALAETGIDISVEPDTDPGRAVGIWDLVSPGHALAAIAAYRLGKPVAWQEARAESMTTGGGHAGFTGRARYSKAGTRHGSRLDVQVLADVGAQSLDSDGSPAWQALDWYGFDDVAVEITHRRSALPPAFVGAIPPVALVAAAEAVVDALARESNCSPGEIQRGLATRSGSKARDLLAEVDDEVELVSTNASSRAEAAGTALAPGLAARVDVTLDRETGEWQPTAVSLAASFRLDPGTELALKAGALDGLGNSATQELCFDEQGNCLAATLMDYVMPSSWEAPEVAIAGVTGVEQRTIAALDARLLATAAVEQAARNAVSAIAPGVQDAAGPITPSIVWQRLRSMVGAC
jgi:CO/xanthine dehydrogenase Mo-binding subunit